MKASFEIEGKEVKLFYPCGDCCTTVTFDILVLLDALSNYVIKINYTQPLVLKSEAIRVVIMPSFAKKLFKKLK